MFCSTVLAGISLSRSLGPIVNEDSSLGSAVLLPISCVAGELGKGEWFSSGVHAHRTIGSCLVSLPWTESPGNQRAEFSPTRVVLRPSLTVTSPGPRQPLFSIPSAIPPSLFSLARAGTWSLLFNLECLHHSICLGHGESLKKPHWGLFFFILCFLTRIYH